MKDRPYRKWRIFIVRQVLYRRAEKVATGGRYEFSVVLTELQLKLVHCCFSGMVQGVAMGLLFRYSHNDNAPENRFRSSFQKQEGTALYQIFIFSHLSTIR